VNREEMAAAFRDQFSGEPEVVAVAPGRVNLIGEHTDYNEGYVFPAAIDREIYVAARMVDGTSSVHSRELGRGAGFDSSKVEPGQIEGWSAYPAGMAWAIRQHAGVSLPNIQALVASTLPMGSGVSSSAAIELAFGVAFNELADLEIDNKTLALIAQRCENEFVGVSCGIMDQLASAMGKAGSAMFLDTRTLDIEYAPLPEQMLIVVCDTKTPRALTSSAYNERRGQCQTAAEALGVPWLRDASLAQLRSAENRMSEVVRRRAAHVISENERCLQFRDALGKNQLAKLGELMRESHLSLRDDYEVSSPELDAMAESCWEAPGCIGARMTGAGFGGACVALVEALALESFSEYVSASYSRRNGTTGQLTACKPVEGARSI
jgi:galactokinase